MLERIVSIAGYSGHGFVVAEAAFLAGINLTHYSDLSSTEVNPFHLDYLGSENDKGFFEKHTNLEYILGIGDNNIRRKVYMILKTNSIDVLNVIHPSASVSNKVVLGNGNFISKNTSLNPMVKIEDGCIINTGAIIEHECKIGSYTHIAPGAVLAGNVTIGEGSFVGANTVIKEGVTVGDNVIIGAGSVVIKDITHNKVVVGNPSHEI